MHSSKGTLPAPPSNHALSLSLQRRDKRAHRLALRRRLGARAVAAGVARIVRALHALQGLVGADAVSICRVLVVLLLVML